MDVAQLKYLYNKVNSSFKTSFVYHVGGEAGFFSEYNNMILGMLYCLDKQISFSIYSKDANFKYDKGWTDYFLPFCEEKGNIFHSLFNVRHLPKYKRWIYRVFYKCGQYCFERMHPSVLTTIDLWNDIHYLDINKFYDFLSLGIKGDVRSICQKLISMTWVYNDLTKRNVEEIKKSINLPRNYIGFHIRGGDKFMEASLSNVNAYIDKAESKSNLRYAFVLTDDYSVFEMLVRNYPSWRFSTLCGENEHGYYHAKFINERSDIKRQRYYKLFASIDILAESDMFIGTFSSNPGMYLGMRMDSSKVFSVDIPEWKIW
jgi:hypothetical protein